MIKRKIAFGLLIPSTIIVVPIMAAISCGKTEINNEEYTYKGYIYKHNSHELNPDFINSLQEFKRKRIEYIKSKRTLTSIVVSIVNALKDPADKSNLPKVVYDFSSLNLDYFSPEIFNYMDYKSMGVNVIIILDNNKLKSFDFSSIPSSVSTISFNHNLFSGKLDMSFISKIHPLLINLNNNQLTSIDYSNIKKYIKSANYASNLAGIEVFSDSKSTLSWEFDDSQKSIFEKLQLLISHNNIDKLKFERNVELINNLYI